jgi:hypothetical protein
MDDVRNGWNTAPACVLGTCGARRRFGLGRLGRRRACPCRSGRLSPRHCALDTRRNAAIVHLARGGLWICGQRKGVAHKSTGPASSSQRQFVCLETVGLQTPARSPPATVSLGGRQTSPVTAPSLRGFRPPFTPFEGTRDRETTLCVRLGRTLGPAATSRKTLSQKRLCLNLPMAKARGF